MDPKVMAYFAAGIGAALTIIGGSSGIGRLAAAAMESIARQPNAAGDIRGAMVLAAGLIEGVTLLLADRLHPACDQEIGPPRSRRLRPPHAGGSRGQARVAR